MASKFASTSGISEASLAASDMFATESSSSSSSPLRQRRLGRSRHPPRNRFCGRIGVRDRRRIPDRLRRRFVVIVRRRVQAERPRLPAPPRQPYPRRPIPLRSRSPHRHPVCRHPVAANRIGANRFSGHLAAGRLAGGGLAGGGLAAGRLAACRLFAVRAVAVDAVFGRAADVASRSMMSRSRTPPSCSASRQATTARMVSGLSHKPPIIFSRPASMRLAISISPRGTAARPLPISRRYMRTGSSVRPTSSATLPLRSAISPALSGSFSSDPSASTTLMPITDSRARMSSRCSWFTRSGGMASSISRSER